MTDLATTYLGLPLQHPVLASAGPLSRSLDGIRELEDAGAAAIVLFSLFEEQIRLENAATAHLIGAGAESFPEALDYFPALADREVGPEPYLELIRRAREATAVPIIASLNGMTREGWVDYARKIEQAGATALELNLYHVPADPATSGRAVEELYLHVLREVRAAVRIPLAMKLSPFFSAPGAMARQLADLGADGLVLFNRFYQPDFDLETLEVAPTLQLSRPEEIRLPLLWIAILHGRIEASLAASTGVHAPDEVVKYLLAGADAVMTTSALLQHGARHLETLVSGLRQWLERRGYASVEQMKGSMSQRHVAHPAAFERANYIRVLESFRPPPARR
ncbi:MAG TPA: dihydroorotate dehydrogenase-like protein [Geminicoccaceae bacterium]|nr:dihydroorotate dehydrogenase-like protein [Geminicoccaceae bacterium]